MAVTNAYTVFIDHPATRAPLDHNNARVRKVLGGKVGNIIATTSDELPQAFARWASRDEAREQGALIMGNDESFLRLAAMGNGPDGPALGHIPANGGQCADRLGFSSDTDEALRLYAAADGRSEQIDLASVNGLYFISEARFDTGVIDYARELEKLDRAGTLKKPLLVAGLMARFAVQGKLPLLVTNRDARITALHEGVGFGVSNNLVEPLSVGAEFLKRARKGERAAMKSIFGRALNRNARDRGRLGFYAWTGDTIGISAAVAMGAPWTSHDSISTLEASAFSIAPTKQELDGREWTVHLDGREKAVTFPMEFQSHPKALKALTPL